MSNYIHESEDLTEFFHGDIIIDLEEEKIDGKNLQNHQSH